MAVTEVSTDPFVIAGETLHSRLLLGTGGFRSLDATAAAIEASGTALVTLALKSFNEWRLHHTHAASQPDQE